MTARDVIAAVLPTPGPMNRNADADAILSALHAAGYVIERGWRPIETAPRDGTRVLVFAPPSGSEYPAMVQRVDWWRDGGWWQMRPAQPYTLWRPLPATPEETSDAP